MAPPGARRSPKARALPGTTVITFAPVSAKFVRITQTAAVERRAPVVDAAAATLPGALKAGS